MKKNLKLNIALSDKDREIIRIASLILIIVIDIIVILWLQLGSFSKHSKEGKEIKESITALKNDISILDRYKLETKELEAKVNDLKLFITEEVDMPVLVENISNIANICGVKILQIRPMMEGGDDLKTVSTKEEKFGEIEIQIVAIAAFHQLGNLVSKIESAPNFFRLSSLRIDNDAKDYMLQNINLTLKTIIKISEQKDKKDSGKDSKRHL